MTTSSSLALALFVVLGLLSAPAHAFMDFTHMKPYRGPWGQKVTLYGKNFDAQKVRVYFNNKRLTLLRVTKRTITVVIPYNSQSGWVEVAQGGRRLRAPQRFIVKNRTVLKSIEPAAAPPDTWVTARGLFFTRSTRFYLGYMRLKTRYKNYREVQLYIPEGAPSGFLSHTNFGQKVQTRVRYTVTPLPRVTHLESRRAWYGDTLEVKGTHFCFKAYLTIGTKRLKTLRRRSRSLRAKIPRHTTSGPLTLHCFDRTFPTGAQIHISAPYGIITGVEPKAGPAGSWVTLKGEKFTRRDRFWLGRKSIRHKKFLSSEEVRIRIPKGAKTDIFHHQTFGKIRPSQVAFIVDTPPTISRLSTTSGWYGTAITVIGDHFCPSPRVTLGGRPVRALTQESRTRLTFRVTPQHQSGPVRVTCRSWVAHSKGSFTLTPPKIQLLSLLPRVGPPGTHVTLRGRHFPKDLKIMWRGRTLKTQVLSSTHATVVISGRGKGPFTLFAYNKRHPTTHTFQVAWPKPIPAGFSPKTTWHRGALVIQGDRFCATPVVTLVHPKRRWVKRKLTVLRTTPTKIHLLLPKNTFTGKLWVRCYRHTVEVPGGPLRLRPPVGNIASVHPSAGPPLSWVTLHGSKFHRRLSFFLGKKPMKMRFLSPNTVQVQIPPGATSGRIAVQTGTTQVTTTIHFKVAFATPLLNDLTPDLGWTNTKMTITGRNFCPKAKVLFPGNIRGKVAERLSHTRLVVLVPGGAKSGYVKVVCPNAVGTARRWFTMAPPYARVHQVTPTLACPGDTLQIRGIHFGKGVQFFLGARRMSVRIVNQYKAIATIPRGARSGDVKVRSFGKTLPSTHSVIIKSRICKNRKK